MEKEHQKPVGRIISSAEGGTGFLHRVTKRAVWRDGLQVIEDVEDDVKPMNRCEERRKE